MEWLTRYGYVGLFLGLLLEIVGLPIPGETMLTAAGYLIDKGRLSFPASLAVSLAGSLCGITLSYTLGRTLGYRLIHRWGPKVGLTEARLAKGHDWFERIGKWTLTLGYFVPGVRHLSGLVAGASGLEYPVFALFAYPGGVLWVASFLSLGYYFGEEWGGVSAPVRRGLAVGAVVVAGLGLLWGVWALARRLRRTSGR